MKEFDLDAANEYHQKNIEEQGFTKFESEEETRYVGHEDVDESFAESEVFDKMRELQRQGKHDEAGKLANEWCEGKLDELLNDAFVDFYDVRR